MGKEEFMVPWSVLDKKELQTDLMAAWTPSMVIAARLESLVVVGVLPPNDFIEWQAASEEVFPTPNTGEIVFQTSFFDCGFYLSAHRFLRGLLYFYGLELHNLNPNGMLHVACFITLCECFLGIELHIAPWKSLFVVKPQPNKAKPMIIGAIGFQLRASLVQTYLELLLQSSNKG